jgi:hypothetical protein
MSYYQGQMQNPYGQNGPYNSGHGQGQGQEVNPLFSNALGLMKNKDIQQMGVSYLQSQLERRITQAPSLGDYIFTSNIRSYFDVDNRYVLRKLAKIVFPFKSTQEDYSQPSGWNDSDYGMTNNQQEDHHQKRLLAPDLYIPLMAFMTFILMVCLSRGIGKAFEPSLISRYTTNCLFWAVLEMLFYKLILLIFRVKTLSFFDLIAYLNYKFVGLCVILFTHFLFGGWIPTLVTLYFSVSFVYYMYVELRSHAQGVTEGIDIGKTSLKSDKIVYLLSGPQFATMWILVRIVQ